MLLEFLSPPRIAIMLGISSISFAKLNRLVREKANQFLHFAYDRKTGEVFGKTCKSWGMFIASYQLATHRARHDLFLSTQVSPSAICSHSTRSLARCLPSIWPCFTLSRQNRGKMFVQSTSVAMPTQTIPMPE